MAHTVACYDCGSRFDFSKRKRCHCGEPLWFDIDASDVSWPDGGTGIWRYAEVLPITEPVGLAGVAGGTPLHRTPQLESDDGPRIHLKLEGTNPTGSFKDRGSAVGVSAAIADGTSWVGTVSHGNMAVSVAAHAASTDLECVVLVAEETSQERLELIGQHDPHLFRAIGPYGDLYYDTLDLDVGIEFVNSDTPLRVAGQKTVAYEICETFAPTVPDAIVLPVSSGGNASAIWKALRELVSAGLLESGGMPRLYLIQAARCDPIARAYRNGAQSVTSIDGDDTIAVSIANGDPPSGTRALTAARETGGAVLSVSEGDIRKSTRRLATDAGLSVEPSSALVLPAIEELTRDGALGADDDVVGILTGSGYKERSDASVTSQDLPIADLESELSSLVG